MLVRSRPLPKKFYLGPEWEISIKVIDAQTMGAVATPDTAGLWDKETKTILILKEISKDRQWSALCEELAHALIDKLANVGH